MESGKWMCKSELFSCKGIDSILVDSRKIIDPSKLADEFNNFFVNISPKLAANILATFVDSTRTAFQPFHLWQLWISETKEIIYSLKDPSSGDDHIKASLGKGMPEDIVTPLMALIIIYLSAKVLFPKHWNQH